MSRARLFICQSELQIPLSKCEWVVGVKGMLVVWIEEDWGAFRFRRRVNALSRGPSAPRLARLWLLPKALSSLPPRTHRGGGVTVNSSQDGSYISALSRWYLSEDFALRRPHLHISDKPWLMLLFLLKMWPTKTCALYVFA